MPRLPTIRVMGSQAISTNPLASFVTLLVAIALPPRFLVAGQKFPARRPPLRLVLKSVGGYLAQPPDGTAVEAAGHGGDPGARRLVHERHELVGKARHGAADTDASHVGATADAVDPPPFGDIALDDRPPASELHDALRGPVLGGEVALLVIASPVAPLVHGGPEQP